MNARAIVAKTLAAAFAWGRSAVQAVEIDDVVTFGGLALVGVGLYAIYPPAAAIVCGCALFWLGVR